ncbi:hypothetical protein [Desulforamulus aeronauticus]|uniref:Lipoprotein n=1 Tax=Desulforamulus aeronauticus DSM 10349 TaxID=1121421 RepID=A0A1M6V877_9FIRM|nr:hypothetical protein [Desulforamulus aeronauticus]SHK77648.1 hypothetical protein SAMN02745123_03102 [Desulforamulus aeronauticus DSM 10349]
MKKKILLLLALSLSLSLVLFGCGGSSKEIVEVKTPEEAAKMEGDPIQNLALKEKQWLSQLDVVRSEISKSYDDWEQGKISKEDFLGQLNKSKETIKPLIKDYDLHMEVNAFPEDSKNEEIYKDGLAYGDKLRAIVNNFIFMATEGIMDSQTNKLKPLTDDQIKDVYKKYMVERYDEYKAKLSPALENAAKK